MFIRKRKLASLFLGVLLLVLFMVVPAWAEGAEDDNATDWYVDAGVSLFVMDLPEYAPLWSATFVGGTPPPTDYSRITLMNGAVVAPLYEATLGRELADQWFVETRLEYAAIGNQLDQREGDTIIQHVIIFCPLDGVSVGVLGTRKLAELDLNFSFQQYGTDLVVGKTYEGDGWHLRPFAGYWFQETDVAYRLLMTHASDPEGERVSEKLETMYNGLLVGVEWTFPINGGEIELGTTHGVAGAHTRYRGSSTEDPGLHTLDLNADELAYRGTLQFSATSHEVNGWKLGTTCELRYLSYVPRIIASGQATDADMAGPTHLVGESSFSGKISLNLSYSF